MELREVKGQMISIIRLYDKTISQVTGHGSRFSPHCFTLFFNHYLIEN